MSDQKSQRKRLFLIDGYAMLYRAHFAMIRNPLINSKGMHTSALFGFTNQVLKLLRQEKPDYLMAAFDSSKKTFRHDRYPEYKATREKMPDEMREQLPYLWQLMEAMRIPTMESPGFEADDIIGTLAKQGEAEGFDIYIVSGDKDFMQLVNDHIYLYSPSGRQAELKIFDREGVVDKWGVPPEKIIDLFGLMGDSSDNIPGVMGVGEKTAVKLLNEYGSLVNALDHADKVKNKRAREGLQNCREDAILSQELVTIKTDMDLDTNFDDMATDGFDVNALDGLFRELEFQALQTQLNAFHGEVPTQEKRPEKNYKALIELNDIQSFVDKVKTGEWLSFDLETTSVEPMRCDIVGLSFSTTKDSGVYIPIHYKEKESDLFDDHLSKVLDVYAGKPDLVRLVIKEIEDSSFMEESPGKGVFQELYFCLIKFLDEAKDKGLVKQDIEAKIVASMFMGCLIQSICYDDIRENLFSVSLKEDNFRANYLNHIVKVFLNGIHA